MLSQTKASKRVCETIPYTKNTISRATEMWRFLMTVRTAFSSSRSCDSCCGGFEGPGVATEEAESGDVWTSRGSGGDVGGVLETTAVVAKLKEAFPLLLGLWWLLRRSAPMYVQPSTTRVRTGLTVAISKPCIFWR